ncbi:Tat pathway signal protein [Halobacteriales archaeon QS_5_70_15]|nr:MAG: Tat pathway signal protein [Halobacteriales archaeon QS_5_70_15]
MGESGGEEPSARRRDVLRAAVAVGGAAGLSACLDVTGGSSSVETGPDDLSTLPERQHAWNDRVRHDEHGNTELPRHQTLLYLDLRGSPDAGTRATVEAALRTLDRAFVRSHEGLIHSMAYSPAYFDRHYDESLPEDLGLPEPRALSPFEEPEFDRQDALLHLAADGPDVLLRAEAALSGERDSVNGVDVEAALTDAFEVADRRTGFVGAGIPASKQEGLEGVPEDGPVPETSPLFMGFKAGFAANQATEDYVTLGSGPFVGGTTKHVANIRQRLADWYGEQSFDERVMEMFSPAHAERGLVEGVGENLGADSGVDRFVDDVEAHAREFGRAGHAQKAARANRDAEGNVRLLRRHFESADDNVASLHFPSLQRDLAEFEAVREAMNGGDLPAVTPAVRQRVNNGILEYIFVRHRGNWLVPPRSLRALPTPTGGTPGL